MKKQYEKPKILFESFTLSTSIAGDCDEIITNATKNICGYEPPRMPGYVIFLEKVTGCITTADDGSNNGVCYHNPTPTTKLFNS
jgi:hypothetical protein